MLTFTAGFKITAAWTGLGKLEVLTEAAVKERSRTDQLYKKLKEAQAAGVATSSALADVSKLLMLARNDGAAGATGSRKRKAVQQTAQVAAALGTAIGLATRLSSSGLRVRGLVEEASSDEDEDGDSASSTAAPSSRGAGS